MMQNFTPKEHLKFVNPKNQSKSGNFDFSEQRLLEQILKSLDQDLMEPSQRCLQSIFQHARKKAQ